MNLIDRIKTRLTATKNLFPQILGLQCTMSITVE